MAMELLRQIQEAEAQADKIRQDAADEAREMVKAAEAAIAAQQRQEAKDIRELTRQALSDAQAATEDEIQTMAVRRSAQREELKRQAQGRVKEAERVVFERIIS